MGEKTVDGEAEEPFEGRCLFWAGLSAAFQLRESSLRTAHEVGQLCLCQTGSSSVVFQKSQERNSIPSLESRSCRECSRALRC